ncbi:MAG TPA: multidrug ABC transporter ATP-binding protein, partial [Casimicrobiaceae bacterium]
VEDKAALMTKLGKKRLTLQLAHPLNQIPSELANYHLELSDAGNALTYTYDTQGERTGIVPLLDRLSEAGIVFKDLRTVETSLEDIFVSLVKEAP